MTQKWKLWFFLGSQKDQSGFELLLKKLGKAGGGVENQFGVAVQVKKFK